MPYTCWENVTAKVWRSLKHWEVLKVRKKNWKLFVYFAQIMLLNCFKSTPQIGSVEIPRGRGVARENYRAKKFVKPGEGVQTKNLPWRVEVLLPSALIKVSSLYTGGFNRGLTVLCTLFSWTEFSLQILFITIISEIHLYLKNHFTKLMCIMLIFQIMGQCQIGFYFKLLTTS